MRLILSILALVCVAAVASAAERYTAPGGCIYEKQADGKWEMIWCPNRDGAKGIPAPQAAPGGIVTDPCPGVYYKTGFANPPTVVPSCIPQQMAGSTCGQPAAILQGPQWHPLQRFRGFFRPHCRGL